MALGMVTASVLSNPASEPLGFWDNSSVLLVVGGAVAALFACYPMGDLKKLPGITKKFFFNNAKNPLVVIEQLVSLGETARRDGLLALENRLEEIDDKFLAGGIRMAVDGMSVEIVESIMRTEMDAIEARHKAGKAMWGCIAKYAPAYGMMGTLIALVIMLTDLSPETIGPGMALAILTTLYGALMANAIAMPISEKLAYLSEGEINRMEITVRGVIAIQSGENPRVIKQKLMTFVPANQRPVDDEGA